jgi:MFS family permease
MYHLMKIAFAPLLSLFILILGNGLFNTLITIRLNLEGNSAFIIGLATTAYYAGLVCASFKIERTIIRVGHIRAFAAFASILAIVTLLQGMFVVPWFWLVLRFISGGATAGLFIVIESWLLILGTVKTRGQILALYMLVFYCAQGLGQFLINLAEPTAYSLFAITAMLCSLSIIPLTIGKIGTPQFEEPVSLTFVTLYKKSTSGIVGCFCSGLILGTVYGLLPLYIAEKTQNASDVALFMALTIFGGMALQYPLGKLSDYVDRRNVLIGIALLTIVASLAINLAFHSLWFALINIFIFGGLAFTFYPVSISHACDSLAPSEIVAGTQGLLLAYSVGATIGPMIAPVFIKFFGINGLFIYFITISAGLAAFFIWRKTRAAPTAHEETFVVMPQTTPITAELDPRAPSSTK